MPILSTWAVELDENQSEGWGPPDGSIWGAQKTQNGQKWKKSWQSCYFSFIDYLIKPSYCFLDDLIIEWFDYSFIHSFCLMVAFCSLFEVKCLYTPVLIQFMHERCKVRTKRLIKVFRKRSYSQVFYTISMQLLLLVEV